MAEQMKKLLYDKHSIDAPDGKSTTEWKISPWKVFVLFITLSILSIVIYAYAFTKDPTNFFGNIMFYAVVLILAIVAIWLVGHKAWSLKTMIGQFIITFIILWVFYWILSFIFGYIGLKFYIGGYALWAIMALLAGYGHKNFDKELNRKDVFFSLLVFLVFVGANLPMNSTGGFLANFDKILTTIFSFLKI